MSLYLTQSSSRPRPRGIEWKCLLDLSSRSLEPNSGRQSISGRRIDCAFVSLRQVGHRLLPALRPDGSARPAQARHLSWAALSRILTPDSHSDGRRDRLRILMLPEAKDDPSSVQQP